MAPRKHPLPLVRERFGRLVVVGEPTYDGRRWMLPCLCDCGARTDVQHRNLYAHNTQSCGCLKNERTVERNVASKGRPRNGRPRTLVAPAVGSRFDRWTVMGGTIRRKNMSPLVPCRCDCGTDRTVMLTQLSSGRSRSCGCLKRDTTIARSTTHGDATRENETRLYSIWLGMKQRCSNPRGKRFSDYGGRGIRVCSEWRDDFVAFREWAMANGYADDLEIDRRDNDGNYEPSNCRWVTRTQNVRNTRHNRIVAAFGETKCLTEWAEDDRCVIGRKGLHDRLALGWPPERAITEPPRNPKPA